MKKELSVIIPAFNEEGKIAETLGQVVDYLSTHGYLYEILVVNDGSRDATAERAKDMARKHPAIRLIDRRENFGKGRTVKEGIAEAKFPYCLMMDADNSTRISEWGQFEKKFDEGFKVVIASRHLHGSRIGTPQPWARRFLGTGYRILCQALFGLRCSDFNCGFKAYETPIAKDVYAETRMRDWTFDVEVSCLLKKRGITFAEVPVRWWHEQKASEASAWAPVRTAWKTLGSVCELKKTY
ncbi:MAG: glycosyltransferase [Candidatus Omnitrophota bacterium]